MKNLIDPNEVNHEGKTALYYACKQGSLKTVKLLANKTDFRKVDKFGRTYCSVARRHGNKNVVEYLEAQKGALNKTLNKWKFHMAIN